MSERAARLLPDATRLLAGVPTTMAATKPTAAPLTSDRCPTIEQLIRASSGELPPAERDRIAQHAAGCRVCRAAWERACGGAPTVAAVAAAPAAPRRSRTPFYLAMALLAVALAVLVGGFLVARSVMLQGLSEGRATTSVLAPQPQAVPAPPAATTSRPAPSLSAEIDHFRRALRDLSGANARFRRAVTRHRGGPAVMELWPAANPESPAPARVQRHRAGAGFGIVLHVPDEVTSIDIVDTLGAWTWHEDANPRDGTVRITFPDQSLPPGRFEIRALDGTNRVAAAYAMDVIDAP